MAASVVPPFEVTSARSRATSPSLSRAMRPAPYSVLMASCRAAVALEPECRSPPASSSPPARRNRRGRCRTAPSRHPAHPRVATQTTSPTAAHHVLGRAPVCRAHACRRQTAPWRPRRPARADWAWLARWGRPVPHQLCSARVRMPAANDRTTARLRCSSGGERRQRRAGILRLDRDDDEARARRPLERCPRVASMPKSFSSAARAGANASPTAICSRGTPRRSRPPMSARPMLPPPRIANFSFCMGLAIVQRASSAYVSGAPNSAVPIRTMVAPSSIAASRSPLMPIESVSSASPLAVQMLRAAGAAARTSGAGAPGRPRRAAGT